MVGHLFHRFATLTRDNREQKSPDFLKPIMALPGNLLSKRCSLERDGLCAEGISQARNAGHEIPHQTPFDSNRLNQSPKSAMSSIRN